MIDDDAIMNAWVSPSAKKAFSIDNFVVSRNISLDIESLRRTLRHATEDPIEEHARMLGLDLSEAIRKTKASASDEELLGRSSFPEVAHVDWTSAKIRATMSPLIGDPGTASDLTLMFQDREEIARFCATEEDYARLMSQPRCVFTGQPWYVLMTTPGSFFIATMAGIDLGPYMAPVMPSGRGEDAMLGSLLKNLYRGDLYLLFPAALEHLPSPQRTWRVTSQSLVDQILPGGAFDLWMSQSGISELDIDPADKLLFFGEHFLRLSSSPRGRNELRDILRSQTKLLWGHIYGELAKTYVTIPDDRRRWKADVGQALGGLQGLLSGADVSLEDTFAYLIHQTKRYFASLEAWNRACSLVSKNPCL